MFPTETDSWLSSLSENEQLQVFKALSGYLSVRELRMIMAEVEKGKSLYQIHKKRGLLEKYAVDLLRIRRLLHL